MRYSSQIMSLPHEVMYLKNTSEDIVVRSRPGRVSKFFARHRGGKEYEVHHLSDLLQETLKEANKISKREYICFR